MRVREGQRGEGRGGAQGRGEGVIEMRGDCSCAPWGGQEGFDSRRTDSVEAEDDRGVLGEGVLEGAPIERDLDAVHHPHHLAVVVEVLRAHHGRVDRLAARPRRPRGRSIVPQRRAFIYDESVTAMNRA